MLRGPPGARGGRRRREPAPTGGGSESRQAPGGRTGRAPAGGTNSHSAPESSSEGDCQGTDFPCNAPALHGLHLLQRGRRSRTRSRCRPARRRHAPAATSVAALGREADRRERPLADDHRVDELDGDVAGVRARRRASPRRRPGGRRAQSAPPCDGSSARCGSACASKNAWLAWVRSPVSSSRRSASAGAGARQATAPARCGTPEQPVAELVDALAGLGRDQHRLARRG